MLLSFAGWVCFPFFSALSLLHRYSIRKMCFNELQSVNENILNQSDNEMVELLLYGSNKCKFQQNYSILKSVKFIIKSERFSGSFI